MDATAHVDDVMPNWLWQHHIEELISRVEQWADLLVSRSSLNRRHCPSMLSRDESKERAEGEERPSLAAAEALVATEASSSSADKETLSSLVDKLILSSSVDKMTLSSSADELTSSYLPEY